MITSFTVSRALIKIAKEANPPLRLPLGGDAQWVVQNKLNDIKRELDQWDELTLSSVADDADPLFFKKLSATMASKA